MSHKNQNPNQELLELSRAYKKYGDEIKAGNKSGEIINNYLQVVKELKERGFETIPVIKGLEKIIPPSKELQFLTDRPLYNEIIYYMKKTFPAHSSLLNDKFKWSSNDLTATGSNPYIVIAIDMFLKKENSEFRVATLRDLEANLQMNTYHYKNVGLILRSIAEPNKDQAKHLYQQLKKVNPEIEFPILIELRDLELDTHLNFKLIPESRYKTVNCLELGNNKSPGETWTTEGGLASLCLRDHGLDSSLGSLAYSHNIGRVVLAKVEH